MTTRKEFENWAKKRNWFELNNANAFTDYITDSGRAVRVLWKLEGNQSMLYGLKVAPSDYQIDKL